jgi:hypothetical protein
MQLKTGARLKSAVDETEVIVVRAPAVEVELGCGGYPMIALAEERPSGLTIDASLSGGTQLGKRFANEDKGLEVLCTKGGQGTLTVDGEVLGPKEAKPLPASD